MKKLIELLVVEGQLKAQAQATRSELRNTFEKKRHLFEEKRKTFRPNAEGAQTVTEEQSDIQSTVADEMKWISGIWTKALDTSFQVAEGNTKARADVVLDNGTVLLPQVPATFILELEHRMNDLQELVKSIPTLDPAKSFRPDPAKGANVFAAREVTKSRTQKVIKPLVLYPATTEHPAQTDKISVDEVVGTITEQEWSGMITPARKGQMIERVEEVRRALKSALQRANGIETLDSVACGKKIFDFVLESD